MDNQDKILEKIKNAAHNNVPNFEAMEQVWNKIEHKLDNQTLQKESRKWKYTAVAASIVVLITVLYQFNQTEPTSEQQNVPVIVNTEKDPLKKDITNTDTATNQLVDKETLKKKLVPTINDASIVYNEPKAQSTPAAEIVEPSYSNNDAPQTKKYEEIINKDDYNKEKIVATEVEYKKDAEELGSSEVSGTTKTPEGYFNKKIAKAKNKSNGHLKGKIFDAIIVRSHLEENQKNVVPQEVQTNKALVVIDGKVVPENNLNDDDVEEIVELTNPIYIINGVEYTEESLFGKNPTSPYYPLTSQDIEKVEVFQADKAIEKFGSKGKNGIVVIKTKNSKPKE